MFKSIPKSSISNRSFKTYKSWRVDNTQYPIMSASLDTSIGFDTSTHISTSVDDTTLYNTPLYRSIKSKYYSNSGNVFQQFGLVENPANFEIERKISTEIRIISIPRDKFGEQIKLNSVEILDTDNTVTYIDDGNGGLFTSTFDYIIDEVDFQTETIVFSDPQDTYEATLNDIDFDSGSLSFIYDGNTYQLDFNYIDFNENRISLPIPLGWEIENIRFGNVFYDDGLIVFTDGSDFTNYDMTFNSTHTIHETEVLVDVEGGEFNVSQNPSAVITNISGSYQFETTPITNILPTQSVKIIHVNDKKIRQSFSGSYNSFITGSWNDYDDNRWTDPTGSYLTPFITTIGLYDDDGNLLVTAKLPQPIKSYPDLPLNFLIRFDT